MRGCVSASYTSTMATIRAACGNLLSGQPGRVPVPVPPLVVIHGDRLRHLQYGRLAVGEDFCADQGVLLHHFELVGRQPAGFLQDRVGNADLADVVHRGRQPQKLGVVRRPTGCPGQHLAEQSGAAQCPPVSMSR